MNTMLALLSGKEMARNCAKNELFRLVPLHSSRRRLVQNIHTCIGPEKIVGRLKQFQKYILAIKYRGKGRSVHSIRKGYRTMYSPRASKWTFPK